LLSLLHLGAKDLLILLVELNLLVQLPSHIRDDIAKRDPAFVEGFWRRRRWNRFRYNRNHFGYERLRCHGCRCRDSCYVRHCFLSFESRSIDARARRDLKSGGAIFLKIGGDSSRIDAIAFDDAQQFLVADSAEDASHVTAFVAVIDSVSSESGRSPTYPTAAALFTELLFIPLD
jgi:hypothetical protein